MKIQVEVQGDDNVHVPTIRIPNALLHSKIAIRKLLDKAGIEMDDQTVEKIASVVSTYIHQYKKSQLLEVEVFSKDGEYVHVLITL